MNFLNLFRKQWFTVKFDGMEPRRYHVQREAEAAAIYFAASNHGKTATVWTRGRQIFSAGADQRITSTISPS